MRIRSLEPLKLQCPTCSSTQATAFSRYSRETFEIFFAYIIRRRG